MKIQIDEETTAEVTFVHENQANNPKIVNESTCAIVNIYHGELAVEYIAFARLHPNDQYCKRIGRRVALTKALAGLPRGTRAMIWIQLQEQGVRFF